MTIKNFFALAQMQTTVTTVLTAILGLIYAWYNYGQFHPVLSLLAILLVLLFLMAVNIRDNYVDYQVASKKGSELADEMLIGRENLSLENVRRAYIGLGLISLFIIIYLSVQTTVYLLFAALIAFFIGILYTVGPIPISSTPSGEVFTGIAMGFGVFFATFYVNTYAVFDVNTMSVLQLILASTPTTICAINIVLANNICDVEEDVEDNRFTLPYYLGMQKSLSLFRIFYYIAYLSILPAILLGALPWLTLFSLLSFPMVQKNIRLFMANQEKERGLRLAVVNSVIIPISILIPLIIQLYI